MKKSPKIEIKEDNINAEKNSEKMLDESSDHYKELFKSYTVIESPDENFNRGFKRALAEADTFFSDVLKLVKELRARLDPSDGSDGGQTISGRPGKKWSLGHDTEWAGLAVLAYGGYDVIKGQLELLQTSQDANGKICHNLPLGSMIHNDASDSTPLYIILAAHYLRFSGDMDHIEELKESLFKAIGYLYSTDRDGDGFIENAGEGQDLIEGDPMHGVQSTFYLSSLWVLALQEASYLADAFAFEVLTDKCDRDFEILKEKLNTDFYDTEKKRYYYGKSKDGRFKSESTVMTAIGMLFGLLNPEQTQSVLDEYAGSSFSTDWGMRLLRNDSDHYKAESYHAGTVWPLYTGWTASAEYEYGRGLSGFTHLMDSLYLYRQNAHGLTEEVINGDVFKRAGEFEHQCWSETAVLYPVLYGMLGFKPDALQKILELKPVFPADWDKVSVKNIVIGRNKVDFTYNIADNYTEYEFDLMMGKPVNVILNHEAYPGIHIEKILTNNGAKTKVVYDCTVRNAVLPDKINFFLSNKVKVLIVHSSGAEVLPIVNQPIANEPQSGLKLVSRTCRIIDSGAKQESQGGLKSSRVKKIVRDFELELNFECLNAVNSEFCVRTFGSKVKNLEGAEIVAELDDEVIKMRLSDVVDDGKYTPKVSRITFGI